MRPPSNDRIRRDVIKTLSEAIETTRKIAAKPDQEDRARWFQVMGYLSQTIDGLLSKADETDADRELDELRQIVLELQEKANGNTSHRPPAKVPG